MASSKTLVFITGGNNGLGYYAIQQLAATGKYHIFMGSRDPNKATAAIEKLAADKSLKLDTKDIEPIQIDVTSDESIYKAAKTIEQKHGYLDILMPNAGIAGQQKPGEDGSPTWRELYRQHYETNLFGAVATVETFLPLLRKSKAPIGIGKRIAFTSSDLGSLKIGREREDLYGAKNFPIYRSTKSALNMVMLSYMRQLEGEGFIVAASNPGFCATDLNGHRGVRDPRDGAKCLIMAATGQKEDVHGWMVDETGVLPW